MWETLVRNSKWKSTLGTRILVFILDHLLPSYITGAICQQMWNLYNMDENAALCMEYDVGPKEKEAFDVWFHKVYLYWAVDKEFRTK